MSKTALKKELNKLNKEQLIEQIIDLYDKNKAVKEFYELYLNPPSETELAVKYKDLILKEFNTIRPEHAGLRFSVAKRAIADFKALQPSPVALADVMLTLPECACKFTYMYGDMTESFYTSAVNNFEAALKFMAKNSILGDFKPRAEQCVKWASPCGYRFADEINQMFREFYG